MSVLPNSPADDIASILDYYDVGNIGQDIVIGPVRLTSSNNNDVVVGLRDVPSDVQPNPAYARDEPAVQFLVHSADRTKRYECWQKAEEVKNTLLGIEPVGITYEINPSTGRQIGFVAESSDVPDVIYAGFIMEDSITSMVDDEEYMLLDFNFRLIREYNIGNRKSL